MSLDGEAGKGKDYQISPDDLAEVNLVGNESDFSEFELTDENTANLFNLTFGNAESDGIADAQEDSSDETLAKTESPEGKDESHSKESSEPVIAEAKAETAEGAPKTSELSSIEDSSKTTEVSQQPVNADFEQIPMPKSLKESDIGNLAALFDRMGGHVRAQQASSELS